MEWENVVAGQRADPEQINKIGNQVSAYKGLRLARRIVLTEAVSSITFDTDDDGNPLDSKLGGELLFWSGESENEANSTPCYLRLNGVTSDVYWGYSGTLRTNIQILNIGKMNSCCTANLNILQQSLSCITNCLYKYGTGGGTFTGGGGMITPQTAVNAFRVFVATGTLPIGTVLEWWERG